jgi:O-antigen/teichoic acid export membrane protein
MPHDLRKYARQTTFQLSIGFIIILFVLGDGLIFLFYGRNAALMGLVCLSGAIIPIAMIVAALWLIDRVVSSNR